MHWTVQIVSEWIIRNVMSHKSATWWRKWEQSCEKCTRTPRQTLRQWWVNLSFFIRISPLWKVCWTCFCSDQQHSHFCFICQHFKYGTKRHSLFTAKFVLFNDSNFVTTCIVTFNVIWAVLFKHLFNVLLRPIYMYNEQDTMLYNISSLLFDSISGFLWNVGQWSASSYENADMKTYLLL